VTTDEQDGKDGEPGGGGAAQPSGGGAPRGLNTVGRDEKPQPTTKTFPAGSYIVRMDQPFSRIADALLDYQYWSPNDPQRTPYDDPGWTFPELFNVQATRVADMKVLDAAAEKLASAVRAAGAVTGAGPVYVVNHNGDIALATLRFRLKDASFDAAEEPFELN